MKRVLSVIIITVLCCGLMAGCTGNEGDKKNKVENKESEKVMAADFDSAENKKIYFRGYQMEIPSNWNELEEGALYGNDEVTMGIVYGETDGNVSMKMQEAKDYVEKVVLAISDDVKILDSFETLVNDETAYRVMSTYSENGIQIDNISTAFINDIELVILTLFEDHESPKDFSEDYGKIINSITIPQIEATNEFSEGASKTQTIIENNLQNAYPEATIERISNMGHPYIMVTLEENEAIDPEAYISLLESTYKEYIYGNTELEEITISLFNGSDTVQLQISEKEEGYESILMCLTEDPDMQALFEKAYYSNPTFSSIDIDARFDEDVEDIYEEWMNNN